MWAAASPAAKPLVLSAGTLTACSHGCGLLALRAAGQRTALATHGFCHQESSLLALRSMSLVTKHGRPNSCKLFAWY